MASLDLVNESILSSDLDTKTFAKIDAPSTTLLTDDLINVFKKGVAINGTFLGYENPVFFPAYQLSGSTECHGIVIGGSNRQCNISRYQISSKTISIAYNIIEENKWTSPTGVRAKIDVLNSKKLPAYPSNTGDFVYKSSDGTLKWDNAIDTSIAPAYDNTATYAVGDYCVYEGILYKCSTLIDTAEDFDSTKWTATNVMTNVPDVNAIPYGSVLFPWSNFGTVSSNTLTLKTGVYDTLKAGKIVSCSSLSQSVNLGNGSNQQLTSVTIIPSRVDPNNNTINGCFISVNIGYYTRMTGSCNVNWNGQVNTYKWFNINSTLNNSSIAPTYSKTSTYNVGDTVIYQNDLYKCNTTISTAEDFNSSHWDTINIATDKISSDVITGSYNSNSTYNVDDIVMYNGKMYKCTTAVTSAEDFDSSKWTVTNVLDSFPTAPIVRMTSTEFNALSSADQTQVIRNGVSIKGTIGGVLDPTFTATDDTYKTGFVMGMVAGVLKFGMYKGDHTNIKWFLESYQLQNPSLTNINALNGKNLPTYPSNTGTFNYQSVDGTLAWNVNTSAESASIAPAYDNTATYSVGDIVMYGNQSYKCKTAVSIAEDFDSTKWDSINVTGEFGNLSYVKKMAAPASTSLTVDELNAFKTGVFLEGTFSGFTNPIITPAIASPWYLQGFIIGTHTNPSGVVTRKIQTYKINPDSRGFSLGDDTGLYYGTKETKNIPSYSLPSKQSTTTKEYTLKQLVGGSLGYVESIDTSIAPVYDNTATYSIGDYCTYSGVLYKCNADISVAEDFDSTHWIATTIDDELSNKANSDQIFKVGNPSTIYPAALSQRPYYAHGIYLYGDIVDDSNRTWSKPIVLGGGFSPNVNITGWMIGLINNKLTYAPFSNFAQNGKLKATNPITLANAADLLPKCPTTTDGDFTLNANVSSGTATYNWNEKLYGQSFTNSTTTLSYEKINEITIAADTTFTLATAQTSCIPEYKALITNSDNANAITITLTGISKVKSNDSNITIVEGTDSTFTIPADTQIELNCFNNCAIVFNWNV